MHLLSGYFDSMIQSLFIWTQAEHSSLGLMLRSRDWQDALGAKAYVGISLHLVAVFSQLLDQVAGQRSRLLLSVAQQLIAPKSHRAKKRPGHLIDLLCVVFANKHTLVGSFSKPHLFSTPKACGGCFSLGTDSSVMYGKSFSNICIRLESRWFRMEPRGIRKECL